MNERIKERLPSSLLPPMLYAQWAPTIYKRAFLKREEQRGWLLLTPRNQAELMFEYVQVHLTMRWGMCGFRDTEHHRQNNRPQLTQKE